MVMKQSMKTGTLVLSLTIALAGSAYAAEGWETYRAEKYGFTMLAPPKAVFVEKELGGGWGALVAVHEGITVTAIGKLGEAATPEEIQKFGVEFTKIDAAHWKLIHKGKHRKGWKWFRTVRAKHEGNVLFGGYGVGPKGNYLMLLSTTVADFKAHKADYKKWYRSIVLD
jgi:hypothetical protein